MNMEITCDQCNKKMQLHHPDKCFECYSIQFETDPVMIEMKKQDRWRSRKKFAYHMILYMPLPIALGLKFGLPINIAFVAGTVYMSLLPLMTDWLSEIF